MALSIGELAGYLTLDDTQFEKGLKGAQDKFSKTGGWIKDNAKKIGLAGGAALGAAIAAGVVANIGVGKANDKLAAQLGLSAKESGRIGKVAGSLYRDAYGDSIEGVNDAVGAVMSSIRGMSNASSGRLEKVTAKALDFATAFDVDVSRAAQVAGQAIELGLAKNATQAFDLITNASQQVPAALREDLLDATDEYGQFFASLGYDGEQAFAMLVDASEKGMYGIDKAGDAIKEFTIRSTDMSKTSKEAYGAIGLNARDMANAILAGGDKAQGVTQKIIKGLLSIEDPSKQAEAAIALFGTPLEDLNTAEIPAFLKSMQGTSDSMDKTAGASKRMGDALNDNFATRMEGWKRQAAGFVQDGLMAIVAGFEKGGRAGDGWKGDLSEIGAFIKSPLLPTVKDLASFVLDNAKAFAVAGGAAAAGYVALKIYRGVVATVTGVQMVATGVTKGYTGAKKLLGKAALGTRIQLGLLKAQTVAVTVAQKVARGATVAMTGAQRALNFAMRMNPIGIVITILVALGIALVAAWKKSETFRKIVKGAWDAIKAAAKFAWNEGIKPVFKWMKDGAKAAWGVFRDMRRILGDVWEGIKDKARNATLWLVDKVLWMAEKVLAGAEAAFGWAPGIGDKLRDAHDKVKGFRKDINDELNNINDEPVKVKLSVGARKVLSGVREIANAMSFGGAGAAVGGHGGAGHGSHGGGHGGGGPMFSASTSTAGLHTATDAIDTAKGQVGSTLSGMMSGRLSKAVEKLETVAGFGPKGKVLRPGSYSVGMPYLGYPGHYGADYPASIGTPVYAMASGIVSQALSLATSYGRHAFLSHPGGVETRYAHMNSLAVRAGQKVRAGQQIGTVGSTGNSTGPHLHFEYRRNGSPVNPAGLGIFDTGGLARNAGLMAKGPKPERILSPRLTERFEAALDRMGTAMEGGRPIIVNDKSGSPVQTAHEVARVERFAGIS